MRRWRRSGESVLDALSCSGDSSWPLLLLRDSRVVGWLTGRRRLAADQRRRPPLPAQRNRHYYCRCCLEALSRIVHLPGVEIWGTPVLSLAKVPLLLSKALRTPGWLSCRGLLAERIYSFGALRRTPGTNTRQTCAVLRLCWRLCRWRWSEMNKEKTSHVSGLTRGFFGIEAS